MIQNALEDNNMNKATAVYKWTEREKVYCKWRVLVEQGNV